MGLTQETKIAYRYKTEKNIYTHSPIKKNESSFDNTLSLEKLKIFIDDARGLNQLKSNCRKH